MDGQHEHEHVAWAFRWSLALNSGLAALQPAIGVGFGSLALIGDALHNLGDGVGLALGWGAERLSRRPARGRFTYGFGRSTQMVALINGLLIFAAGAVMASAWGLLREAIALNLDAVPRAIDLRVVEQALLSPPHVVAVGPLHVWGMSTSRIAFTAHLQVDAAARVGQPVDRDGLLTLARERLHPLGINMTTLQRERKPQAAPPR
jgi:Co/Zn/Cd efflux system component